jgi:hypothetical protein
MEIHLAALASAPLIGAVVSLIAATICACFFESLSDDG